MAVPQPPQRFGALDAVFLNFETKEMPLHSAFYETRGAQAGGDARHLARSNIGHKDRTDPVVTRGGRSGRGRSGRAARRGRPR